jgi:uncharacterized membrane protein YkvA (DUF1232 family)
LADARSIVRAAGMNLWEWLLLVAAFMFAVWAVCVLALALAGRRESARALAGFIPDCIVVVRRLLHDPRVPRRYKLLLAVLFGYLALPIDLVPDFIPVAGQLDDAVVVAVVLRIVLRGGGPELLREHWPGPDGSLALVLRVIGYSDTAVDPADDRGESRSSSRRGFV